METKTKKLGFLCLIGLLLVGVVVMSGCIGECGDLNQNCCKDSKCNAGNIICGSDGKCHACGGAQEPCCGKDFCDEGFACSNDKCEQCGKIDKLCCEGSKCNEGVCSDGKCVLCGSIGELCCEGSKCNEGVCSGGKCVLCGSIGKLCCAGNACGEGVCSGGKCVLCGSIGELCCEGSKCSEGVCSNGKCEKCGGIGKLCCAGDVCDEGTCIDGNCATPPRYDGIYSSTFSDGYYYYYLRFYEDGTVLSAYFREEIPEQIGKQIRKDRSEINILMGGGYLTKVYPETGYYAINGSTITVSFTSDSETFGFNGTISGDTIIASWYDPIDQKKYQREYHFVNVPVS